MPVFTYKAYSEAGAVVTGEIIGATREAALDTLARRGTFPTELEEGGGGGTVKRWWERDLFGSVRLPAGALVHFTRELATLVSASLPIDEALRIVALQPALPRVMRRAATNLLERVVAGASLSEGLAAEGQAFPEYYWRLVAAGERSGSLAIVLSELAGSLERAASVRGKITSALVYPAILLAAATVTVGIVVGVLVPAIAPLFADAGVPAPTPIRFVLAMQAWLGDNGVLAAALTILTLAVVSAVVTTSAGRDRLSRAAIAVPVAGNLIAAHQTARYARSLASLLKAGVPILDGLRIARDGLTNAVFRAAAGDAADRVRQGGRLSVALAATARFSPLAIRLADIGERTGQLDAMLLRLAEITEADLERRLDRLTGLVAPVLTVVIGLVVGGIILSLMGTIVSLNELAIR